MHRYNENLALNKSARFPDFTKDQPQTHQPTAFAVFLPVAKSPTAAWPWAYQNQ